MAQEQQQAAGKLSPFKRLLGFGALVAVVVVCGPIFFLLLTRMDSSGGGDGAFPAGDDAIPKFVLAIMGLFLMMLGAICYTVAILTRCFTFDFTQPFFSSYKGKKWLVNVPTEYLLQMGLALMAGALLMPVLSRYFQMPVLFAAAFFPPFILVQFFTFWFQMWRPLFTSMIRARLRAQGLTEGQLATGLNIGISDATHTGIKRIFKTPHMQDIGMLWIAPSRLVYRGDSSGFDALAQNVERIERKADGRSTSSLFGAIHVILHFRHLDGTPAAVRLHTVGNWTMTGAVREMNQLAQSLEEWHAAAGGGAGAAGSVAPASPAVAAHA